MDGRGEKVQNILAGSTERLVSDHFQAGRRARDGRGWDGALPDDELHQLARVLFGQVQSVGQGQDELGNCLFDIVGQSYGRGRLHNGLERFQERRQVKGKTDI